MHRLARLHAAHAPLASCAALVAALRGCGGWRACDAAALRQDRLSCAARALQRTPGHAVAGYASAAAADAAGGGRAVDGAAGSAQQPQLSALLHAALSQHQAVSVTEVEEARAAAHASLRCAAGAVRLTCACGSRPPQLLAHEPSLCASDEAVQAAAARFRRHVKVRLRRGVAASSRPWLRQEPTLHTRSLLTQLRAPPQVVPALLQLYPPRIVAMMLAGGPRLLERLLDERSAPGVSPHAPPPALLAHLAQQHVPVLPGVQVGDCIPSEAPPLPSKPSSRLLRAAARGGWGDDLDDEEAQDEDEPGGRNAARTGAPPQRARLRTHPRGSPPPREARNAGGKRRSGRR
jgi:hypothetical protein